MALASSICKTTARGLNMKRFIFHIHYIVNVFDACHSFQWILLWHNFTQEIFDRRQRISQKYHDTKLPVIPLSTTVH